jgi:hypothetical protein
VLRERPEGEVPTVVPTPPEAAETPPAPPTFDANLARVVTAWPSLPEALKSAVLAIMKAAEGFRGPSEDDEDSGGPATNPI